MDSFSGVKKFAVLFIVALICNSCSDPEEVVSSENPFAACVQFLGERCTALEGDYCLFGFKWGSESSFSTTGKDAEGPQKSGGTVTYSFQESQTTVNTHKELGVPTQSFSALESCAKGKIHRALRDWSTFANIEFEEQVDDSDSDIKFFVADVSTGGLGIPNINISNCGAIAGHVILSPKFTINCDVFYLYVLHETGHALGLGHSSSGAIMGVDVANTPFTGLQSGDIAGIRQLYGN